MRIREHGTFSHTLKPGEDHDPDCNTCLLERAVGVKATIYSPDGITREYETDAWPPGKKFGELTPEQKQAAIDRAARQFQAELTASADSISHILDEAENPEYTVDVWTPDTYESERTGDDGPERDSSAGA